MSNWNPLTQPVSKFILSDVPSSGICRAPTGAAIVRNLDERAGYGIDCAFLVFTGRKLAEFSTELLLSTVDDWNHYNTYFQPLIHAVPLRGPVRQSSGGYEPGKAHLIWHPQLYPLGITQCVVVEEPQPEIDEFMVGHVVVKFKQVVLTPKPAYARPEAAQADPPLTADQQEIKRLTDQLASARQINQAAGQ